MHETRLARARQTNRRIRLDAKRITRVEILLESEQLTLIDELKATHGFQSRTEIIKRLLHDPAVMAAVENWRPAVTR